MGTSMLIKNLPFEFSDVGGSIGDRFERIVDIFGEKDAYVGEDLTFTYDQLNRHANKIAQALIQKIGPQSCRVGILLDQSGLNFVSIIGTLKAGKCYIPLDPHTPPERLRAYVSNADIKCIVALQNYQNILDEMEWASEDCIYAESLDQSIPDDNPGLSISPDTQGSIIFTSGSTGAPKGVIQPHRSILHNAFSFTREFDVSFEDRQAMLYTPAVYGAQRETFLGLLNGVTLFHYPIRERGVMELAAWIETNKITIFDSVTTVFRRLLGQIPEDRMFPSIRMVKVGGEATYWSDIDLFNKHFSKECRIFCGFSMTETNLLTSMFIEKNQARSGDRAPLGKVVEGKNVSVMLPDGVAAAPGQSGEICVRSRYIAMGYVGDEELSQTRFQFDPKDPSLVTFRTGDLGVFDEDGVLTFEGRKDHQVKIRGYRVDLSEVESAIINQDDIQECVVKTHDFSNHDTRIVAYVVFKQSSILSIAQLRLKLAERLTSYMVPAHFVILDEIPQTNSGKVDRQSLQKPDSISRFGLDDYADPRNEVELLLKACWEGWLGITGVGIDDDFFDIGGDSLSATQLLLDLNETFNVTLDPEDIFNDGRTIRGMSEKLQIEIDNSKQGGEHGEGIGSSTPFDIDFIDGRADINRTNRPGLYRIDSRTGLRVGKPGGRDRHITLNNMGFRSPDIEIDKPEGVVRVAFLGSSNVFDPFAISNDRTWPHLMVDLLRAQFPGRKIDFVNAAFPGYSTVRIEKLYSNFVAPLKPDLIILCTNDLNRDTAYLAREQGVYDGVPFRISALGKRVRLLRRVEKNLIVFKRTLASLNERGSLTFDSSSVANPYRDRLVRLIEVCQSGGASVVMVDCSRFDCNSSLNNKLRSISTRSLYMPYLSMKGMVEGESAYQAARVAAADQTGCQLVDAGKHVPSDRKHYADSTHFRYSGSKKISQYLVDKLMNDDSTRKLFE